MKPKKGDSPIYYKSVNLKFDRPQTETRIVKGYFAAFDIVDSDMDVIRKGAFTKSLEERGVRSSSNRKIKYLHQHNPTEIAGALLELKEDDYGLYFEGQIERTPLGDVILERYSNGTYTEHSFGFNYVASKCNWIDKPITIQGNEPVQSPNGGMTQADTPPTVSVFECTELYLFEGSVVTFGANSNTPFVGFKGTKEEIFKELKSELDFLIKSAPSYEYELAMRRLYQKQFSLLNSEAVGTNTKEESKPKPTEINYTNIISNLKF